MRALFIRAVPAVFIVPLLAAPVAARSGLALGKWRALLKERGAFHGQAAATVREGI